MAHFELVNKFKDNISLLPKRSTQASAGYDFVVAEDTVIQPLDIHWATLAEIILPEYEKDPITLDELKAITKKTKAKPSLVSTGCKVKLDKNQYLELSVRSSCPLNYWLILANGVGIIDADYYNNPDNEGEIFFQLINLGPAAILLRKGDVIGQGIIKTYSKTDDDNSDKFRLGGLGSTDE